VKLFRQKSWLFSRRSLSSLFGNFFHKWKRHPRAVEDLLDGDDLEAVEGGVVFGFELSRFFCFLIFALFHLNNITE